MRRREGVRARSEAHGSDWCAPTTHVVRRRAITRRWLVAAAEDGGRDVDCAKRRVGYRQGLVQGLRVIRAVRGDGDGRTATPCS